jgi:hypothetical protein
VWCGPGVAFAGSFFAGAAWPFAARRAARSIKPRARAPACSLPYLVVGSPWRCPPCRLPLLRWRRLALRSTHEEPLAAQAKSKSACLFPLPYLVVGSPWRCPPCRLPLLRWRRLVPRQTKSSCRSQHQARSRSACSPASMEAPPAPHFSSKSVGSVLLLPAPWSARALSPSRSPSSSPLASPFPLCCLQCLQLDVNSRSLAGQPAGLSKVAGLAVR